MEIVVASILTIFLNKEEDNKILATFLILYISAMEIALHYRYFVFDDYITFYTVCSLTLCIALYIYTRRTYINIILVLSVTLPQLFYLLILHKPYLLPTAAPMWLLLGVDKLFIYGVFFILYEQRNDFNFRNMKFREFIINAAILITLIAF